jgi:hypothetical protein
MSQVSSSAGLMKRQVTTKVYQVTMRVRSFLIEETTCRYAGYLRIY